ncbi:MAG: type 4a pilus biogenesis protein PilO [Sedimentisphaerales bacterium]|nr:type 4a pilus biogenesis protein PilO [Sedimentisphaerales bacterium]
MHKKVKAAKQTRSTQGMIIAKGISDSEQLPLFTNQLHKLKSELSDFEANIPRQRDLGSFVHQIAELMNQYKLKEQEIAPHAEIEAEGLNCIPVSIQCKGRLGQIFQFSQSLQKMDRLIRIKHIKLINDSDFRGEVGLETEVVIYYRSEIVNG